MIGQKHGRLLLIPVSAALAAADLESPSCFRSLLGAEVPESWPPELYDDAAKRWTLEAARSDPDAALTHYVVLAFNESKHVLIGAAGFKSRPKKGSVEIGYGFVPEWQGRGLGTILVDMLLRRAFEDNSVLLVCAHTLEELHASQRVLEKNRFVRRGVPEEEGTIRYEITREEFEMWRARRESNPEPTD